MIDPNLNTNLKHILAQGHSVGDRDYGPDGNLYRWDGNNWTLEGGGAGGGGGINIPPFNFDWTQAREQAMEQLRPYYEQKLKEAGDDVELAKRLIEEDYQRGKRYSQEDFTRGERYRTEDLSTQLKALGLDIGEEIRDIKGALNERGVLLGEIPQGQMTAQAPYSDYAQTWFLGPLSERQQARKLAIERAIQRQGEVAGIEKTRGEEQLGVTKTRGLEEQNIQYPRTQRDIEEEKRQRALGEVVPQRYREEYQKYLVANKIPGSVY